MRAINFAAFREGYVAVDRADDATAHFYKPPHLQFYTGYCPVWRGDGSLSYRHGETLFVDGTALGRVAGVRSCHSWLPDGSNFVVVTNSGAVAKVVTSDFSQQPIVALNVVSGWSEVAVSPDGTRLALTGSEGLWVANLDGSGLRKLQGPAFRRLTWSPDRTRILAANCCDTSSELAPGAYLISVSDGTAKLLSANPTLDVAWSR